MPDDRIKVVVYYDEIDQLEAFSVLEAIAEGGLEVFDGAVEAWIPASGLEAIEQSNLLYQQLAGARVRSDQDLLGLPPSRTMAGAKDDGSLLVPDPVDLATAEPGTYRLQLAGAMRDSWREVFAEAGVEITCFHPPDVYVVELSEAAARRLAAQEWVLRAWPQLTQASVAPDLVEAVESTEDPAGPEQVVVDIILHQDVLRPTARRALLALGWAEVLDEAELLVRARIPLTSENLETIADFPSVKAIRRFAPPALLCDRARALLGVGRINEGRALPWDGSGERILVLDSGVDGEHPDLVGCLEAGEALDGASPRDTLGHGTHVAGIIVGSGAASEGEIQGVAPGARLVSVGITDQGGVPLLPADLGQVFRRALDHDAKVVNASWEISRDGGYEQGALTVDAFVHEHPDVLIVVAAGNSGRAPEGTQLYYTIGSPANAKNVITVGASATDRHHTHKTWGQHSLRSFPEPPLRDLPMCGDPRMLAATSSRGPTEFDSVKPDVVAPGTWILAPRAAGTPPERYWAVPEQRGDRYVYLGGTSMAAPMVSGVALMLRHYLRVACDVPDPSAALLKAMLIASTVPLPPTPGSHTEFGYPDFDQGYGRVDLSTLLPHAGASAHHALRWVDIPRDSPRALRSRAVPGSAQTSVGRYEIEVPEGATEPLRIVLTWIDHPGNGVQNNLKLMVRDPENERLLGNGGHHFVNNPMLPTEMAFDRRNTVEVVRVETPTPGRWRIAAVAENTPFAPQGYALVVCGEFTGSLDAP